MILYRVSNTNRPTITEVEVNLTDERDLTGWIIRPHTHFDTREQAIAQVHKLMAEECSTWRKRIAALRDALDGAREQLWDAEAWEKEHAK
jgi:hypothetical protein